MWTRMIGLAMTTVLLCIATSVAATDAPAKSEGTAQSVKAEEPGDARPDPLRLDALRTAFLYSKTSKTAVPWEEYGKHFEDVRNARDEFERRDRMQAVRADLEREQKAVDGASVFVLSINGELEQYDFERKGFPTGFSDTTFVPNNLWIGGPEFAVSLKNAGRFALLKMDEDQARKVAAAMRECCEYRRVVFRVEVQALSAEKTSMNFTMRRNVVTKVLGMKVFYKNQLIGEIN
jgi:Domain of unknown function (DUF4852)